MQAWRNVVQAISVAACSGCWCSLGAAWLVGISKWSFLDKKNSPRAIFVEKDLLCNVNHPGLPGVSWVGLWSARIAMVQTAGHETRTKCNLICWLCARVRAVGCLHVWSALCWAMGSGYARFFFFFLFNFFCRLFCTLESLFYKGQAAFWKREINGALRLFVDSTHSMIIKKKLFNMRKVMN